MPDPVGFVTAMRRAILTLVANADPDDLEHAITLLSDLGDDDAVRVIEMAWKETRLNA